MEPKALNFGSDSAPAAGHKPAGSGQGASAPREPGQLAFPEKPADAATPSAPAVRQPGALSFPAATPDTTQATHAREPGSAPLFGQKAHGAQQAAREQADALDAKLYAADTARVNRIIDQLLPLSPQQLETWTDGALGIGRLVSTEAATLNRRFTQLGAQTIIEEVTMLLSPYKQKSLLLRMKLNSLRENMPAQEARVLLVKQQLGALNADMRELVPRAKASESRLQANYLALRAVREVLSASVNRTMQLVLASQADMLREAADQASLVALLLERTLEASTTLHADANHLHNNVASFVALAQSGQKP